MKYPILFFSIVFLFSCKNSDTSTEDTKKDLSAAEQLLEKSIAFHDPKGNWAGLVSKIDLVQETPNRPERKNSIFIDNSKSFYSNRTERGDTVIIKIVENDECSLSVSGTDNVTSIDSSRWRLTCENAKMYRDYHTYLYGLPMKLKDPGTLIDAAVKETAFQGTPCQAIRVTYEENVGEDIWYFFFDKNTAEMIGYSFYHDEAKNDGEYITLKDLADIGGIKMPKIRSWYYNSDSTFLGTDIIVD